MWGKEEGGGVWRSAGPVIGVQMIRGEGRGTRKENGDELNTNPPTPYQ